MRKSQKVKIYPAGMSREVYRTIVISGAATLNRLCSAILDAFDFIDEHMYEFCMDNSSYSDYAYQSDPEENEPSADIEIDRLKLTQGQNFSLHYEFGDDWMFTVHVQKISDTVTVEKATVIKSKGEIEQYPDWDCDDEEYDWE